MSLLANLDGVNKGVLALFLILAGLVYLLPSVVAVSGRHRQLHTIAALNIFLGWTIVAWLIAIVLALKNPAKRPQDHVAQWPRRIQGHWQPFDRPVADRDRGW